MNDDETPTHTFDEETEAEDRSEGSEEDSPRRSWVEGAGTG